MLGHLMMKKLNELRLKNVQCDLELVSSDNKSFDIHQIVFTALNQKHFFLAVQQAYSSDVRILSKKKMYLSHMSSNELELLIEFMYGVTVTKKRKYDLLLSALEKLDMMYLLDEVGGFTFDDSPVKLEIDAPIEDQETGVEDAFNGIEKVQSTNEISKPDSTCIPPDTDDFCEIVNLPPLAKCSVKEEPGDFRSEPAVWTVQQSTCNPRSDPEMDILTNEESDNDRKRLVHARDNVNESLLQDLKEELVSDSETDENLDMNEVERVYQNVKESLNYSVLSEVSRPTDREHCSELCTIDKSTSEISSKSCNDLNVDPCNSIASALSESSNKSSNTSSQAEAIIVPLSVIPTTEPDESTSSYPAAEISNLSTDNVSVESLASELSIHSVNTSNSGSFDASKSHSKTGIITDSVLKLESLSIPSKKKSISSSGNLALCENIMNSVPALLTGLSNNIDCHKTESPALYTHSITSSSSEDQPCTVFSQGSVQSHDSSVKSSFMCATISTTDNEHQFFSLPVDVYNTTKQSVGSKCVTQITETPNATIFSDLISENTSKQFTSGQFNSVSNDKSEEIQSETMQLSEVNIVTKPEMVDKTVDVLNKQYEQIVAVNQLPVKLNIEQVATSEVNDVLKPTGPVEQINDDVNCVSEDVTHVDQCTNEESNQSKDHSISEVNIEADQKVKENQTVSELECQSKLVINEDQIFDNLNSETMPVNQNDIFSDLEGPVNEKLSFNEMKDTMSQVVTKCINQNVSETHSVICAAKLSTKVQASTHTGCQTHFHNYPKLRSKSKIEEAILGCNKDVLSKAKTGKSMAVTTTTTSKLMSDTSVTYTSKTSLCTDFNAVLSNRLKQKVSLPNVATSNDVSHDYSHRKRIEVKSAIAKQKSKRKPLFKKESKRSKLGTKNPVLADILNCRRNENVYSQIKELEFEKIDGTSPSDLTECDVLTENATAFLKMSDQNMDTCTGSQVNTLRNSQTNQEVTRIGNVGSIDNIEQLKKKVKNQSGKSVKSTAVSDCIADDNLVNEEVREIIDIDDESSEVVVRSPSSMKDLNNKHLNFLTQTESPLQSSSVRCIIPVSEVLSLTPAQLVANYMSKVEKTRKNDKVKDNSPQSTDNIKSGIGERTLKGNQRVQSNAGRGESDPAANNQTTDKTSVELKDNSNSDIGVQSSEALTKDLKCTNQVNSSMTAASNGVDAFKNVPTITVSPVQKAKNQTSSVRQQCTILPKVPVTMIRFPLRILGHSIQTGKHVIQVEHPTVTSTSISPTCFNTLVPNSDEKFPRKRWKSTPNNDLLGKRKSVDESVIIDLKESIESVNLLDIKKRKLKDPNQTEMVHEPALDSHNNDRAPIVTDNTEDIIMPVLSMASSMKGKLELQNKLEDDVEDASLDDVPLSLLRVKLFDGPSTSNFKQGDANNLTNINQYKEQSSVNLVSNSNNHLSVMNEQEQKAEMEVVLDIKDDPESDSRTLDSVDDDFDTTKDKKCQNNGSDGLKVKLFTGVTKRKKPSDDVKSSSSDTALNKVIENKAVLKPLALKSCRTNPSELRKQIAAQRARRSRLNHKMVLVNGKQAARRRSHKKSKQRGYDLVFKSEQSHSNIQTVAIVPSSVLVLGKTLVNTTIDTKYAISTCSKSTTDLSTKLNSPRPSANQTSVMAPILDLPFNTVESAASITPSSATEPSTLSSWSIKPAIKNHLSPVFTPLSIPSQPVVPGGSNNQVVLLPSSLQTLTSVSTKLPTSVEAINKSPTPVLSSMLLSRPLNHSQAQNFNDTKPKEKETKKYKNTSEKSADDVMKKRVRLFKKNELDSSICKPASYVIKVIDTSQHTVSNNSPYRQILPKPPCVTSVLNPSYNQANE